MLNESEIQNELLDRLVDGELPDGDYRRLIHRLDDSPDGWRRCALSFLEQQALQRDLKQMLKEGQRFDSLDDDLGEPFIESNGAPRVTTPDRWERWLGQPWVRWTSVLAVGVLAFISGVALQPFGSPERPGDDQLAGSNQSRPDFVAQTPVVPLPSNPRDEGDTLFIEDSIAGASKPLEVRALPINYGDGNSLPRFAPDLPPQIVNAIGRSTHPKRIERLFYIVRTQDGKVYILPMDRIIQDSRYQ